MRMMRSQYYYFLHTIRMIICYFLNTTRAKRRNVQEHVASKRNGANDFRISRGVEIASVFYYKFFPGPIYYQILNAVRLNGS